MDKTDYDPEKEALKDEIYLLKFGKPRPKPKEIVCQIVNPSEVVKEAASKLNCIFRRT